MSLFSEAYSNQIGIFCDLGIVEWNNCFTHKNGHIVSYKPDWRKSNRLFVAIDIYGKVKHSNSMSELMYFLKAFENK